MISKYFSFFWIVIFYSCVSFPHQKPLLSSKEKLQKEIKTLIEDSLISNATIGIYIESLSDGEILFKQNESKLFIPASNQKLYTTAVALQELGPEFRLKTEVYTSGVVKDSVLNGNLLIRGKADPSISGRFYDNEILTVFNNWADSLIEKGIKKIKGNIIGLDGYFTDNFLGKGWNWDDETYDYSAQISALSFNENCIDIQLIAGREIGDSVQISKNPKTDYATIKHTISTIHGDSTSAVKYTRSRARNFIKIEGVMAVGDTLKKSITIENPTLWFVTILKDVLNTHGIEVDGELLTGHMPFDEFEGLVEKRFIHYSPPLTELVRVINKESQNFYAEQIFKTIGAEINLEGNAEESAKVVQDWLLEIGIDTSLAVTVDGSGLSRMNLVSPIATAAILRYMYKSPNHSFFYNSLPIAGVDGSLKNRMKNSIAQNILRAKTGFVSHVRTLSGYTVDRAGNEYLFVIMVNNYSVPTSIINDIQDKIGILLTSYNPI